MKHPYITDEEFEFLEFIWDGPVWKGLNEDQQNRLEQISLKIATAISNKLKEN